jgi:hypothetical protein
MLLHQVLQGASRSAAIRLHTLPAASTPDLDVPVAEPMERDPRTFAVLEQYLAQSAGRDQDRFASPRDRLVGRQQARP